MQNVWNNHALYGHCLTRLPGQLWNFTTSKHLATYTKPDPGTAKRCLLIFEMYQKTDRHANGNIARVQAGTNCLLNKYAELGFRRVGGTCLTAGSFLTAAPLGFTIKAIHQIILKLW